MGRANDLVKVEIISAKAAVFCFHFQDLCCICSLKEVLTLYLRRVYDSAFVSENKRDYAFFSTTKFKNF